MKIDLRICKRCEMHVWMAVRPRRDPNKKKTKRKEKTTSVLACHTHWLNLLSGNPEPLGTEEYESPKLGIPVDDSVILRDGQNVPEYCDRKQLHRDNQLYAVTHKLLEEDSP